MEPLHVEIVDAEPVEDEGQVQPPPQTDSPPSPSRKSLFEQLLSPVALQRMMMAGGGLLVAGFVIWLWSMGVFNHPTVAALVIGVTTSCGLAAGISLVRWTRYQLAGRGLTFLAALALPLNLWFYDAQGLITIADGGHLWIPAAIICGIYALVARAMRDATFVYALVGGVVMTGMLFLADAQVGQIWTLLPPVTFLVATGWLSVFASRQFPEEEGDFSRSNFGAAFYRAGIVVMFAGLAALMGGQVTAFFADMVNVSLVPRLASDVGQKLWAAGIVAASTAGFAMEMLLAKHRAEGSARLHVTLVSGFATWTLLTLLDAFSVQMNLSQLAIAIGVAVTGANVFSLFKQQARNRSSNDSSASTEQMSTFLEDSAVALSVCLLVIAGGQFVAQFLVATDSFFFVRITWTAVLQFVAAAIALGTSSARIFAAESSAVVESDEPSTHGATSLAIGGAIAAQFAAWTMAALFSMSAMLTLVWIGLLVPALLVAASRFASDRSKHGQILAAGGSFATCVQIALVGLFAVSGDLKGIDISLNWFALFATASMIYFLASHRVRPGLIRVSQVLSFISAALAASQLAAMCGLDFDYSLVLGPAVGGAMLAVLNRFRTSEKHDDLSTIANSLVLVGNVGGVLLALSHVVDSQVSLSLLAMLVAQLACTTIAGLMSTAKAWKYAFRASAIALVLAVLPVINELLLTHWLHRVEISTVLAGVALLVMGYLAWSRESDNSDTMATVGLTLGSLLVTMPLAMGLVIYRSVDAGVEFNWLMFHEVAAVVAGLALLGSGLLCKVRATTISGGLLLMVHVLSLVLLIRLPEQLQNVSVIMMLGGGLFFATAILLSLYRDRLIGLPEKISEGHGVFRVLKWR